MNFAQPVTKINTEIWMLHRIIGAQLVVTIQTNIYISILFADQVFETHKTMH